MKVETLAEIVEDKLATKRDIKELELRLTVRMGAIMVAGIAAVAAIVKLLK